MWLINTISLKLENFIGESVPPYAILSHRWGDEETGFKDFKKHRNTHRQGHQKVLQFCEIARDQWRLSWAWSDTVCIDKRSSSELSEAINSMFQYYAKSSVCIIYLYDVAVGGTSHSYLSCNPTCSDCTTATEQLRDSDWFTRGWTLQELIAPRKAVFYTQGWHIIGAKPWKYQVGSDPIPDLPDISYVISGITGIPVEILVCPSELDHYTFAQKLSFAANRKTTRLEDRSYSLLGILKIELVLLYGEGHKAWQRLLQEVLRVSEDETIFAWKPHSSDPEGGKVLPGYPSDFEGANDIVCGTSQAHKIYSVTNKGLEMRIKAGGAVVGDHTVDGSRLIFLPLNCFLRKSKYQFVVKLSKRTCGHYARDSLLEMSQDGGLNSLNTGNNLRLLAADETVHVHMSQKEVVRCTRLRILGDRFTGYLRTPSAIEATAAKAIVNLYGQPDITMDSGNP